MGARRHVRGPAPRIGGSASSRPYPGRGFPATVQHTQTKAIRLRWSTTTRSCGRVAVGKLSARTTWWWSVRRPARTRRRDGRGGTSRRRAAVDLKLSAGSDFEDCPCAPSCPPRIRRSVCWCSPALDEDLVRAVHAGAWRHVKDVDNYRTGPRHPGRSRWGERSFAQRRRGGAPLSGRNLNWWEQPPTGDQSPTPLATGLSNNKIGEKLFIPGDHCEIPCQ